MNDTEPQVDRTLEARINLYYDLRPGTIAPAPLLIALHGYGAHKRQMTEPALEAGGPDISPDGIHLAFYSQQNTERPSSIWVGNLDGTDLHRLTKTQDLNAGNPVYSPDGTKIVFNGAPPKSSTFNMYVMNADGTGVKLVLSCPGEGCLFPDWGAER